MRKSFPLLILSVFCGGLAGCRANPEIRVVSSIANPENGSNTLPSMTAQVIEEDFGATVANVTTVRIVGLDGKPIGQGDGSVFSYYRGKPKINISWKDGEHLVIDCADCSDDKNVTLREVKHNRITILYPNEARPS